MYTSSSFERGSPGPPENSTVSRSNIPSRIPVGITPLGDENQQIRIHLAVHKYNNTPSNPFYNTCSVISSNRHPFLRNSPKTKNHEDDVEQTLKCGNERKCGNRYKEVGSYPTVHLKKSAVLYRPIRRFNDAKILNPELPLNRFLKDSSEFRPDLKQNTRSVLDVLQDLSRKRIYSKEEGDSVKSKSRGLGGDIPMDAETAYKPLFVSKSTFNSVLTRDNTTQTLQSHGLDSVASQFGDSNVKNDESDPKAELRKKLARQNNEIFASLSSSVPAYAVKRKIDKVIPTRDFENQSDVSAAKKSKRNENEINSNEENNIVQYFNGLKKDLKEHVKSRKSKSNDMNSLSPNKDRLTTIFLDMQNSSSKSQVFQLDSASNEAKPSTENETLGSASLSNSVSNETNGANQKSLNSVPNGTLEPKNASPSKEKNLLTKTPPTLSFTSSSIKSSDEDKKETNTKEELHKLGNFPVSSSSVCNFLNSNVTSTVQFNFGSPNTTTFNLGFKTSPVELEAGKTSSNEGLLSTSAADTISTAVNCENKTKETDIKIDNKSPAETKNKESSESAVKPFLFGNSAENIFKKTDFSTFKFGVDKDIMASKTQPISTLQVTNHISKIETSSPSGTTNFTNSTQTKAFGGNNSGAITTITSQPTNGTQFQLETSSSNTKGALSTSLKGALSPFAQTLLSSPKQQIPENFGKTEEKSPTSGTTQNLLSNSNSSLFGQNNQQLGLFTFTPKLKNYEPSDKSFLNSELKSAPKLLNESVDQNPSCMSSGISSNENTTQKTLESQAKIFTSATANQTSSFLQNPTTQDSTAVTEESSSKTSNAFKFEQKSVVPEVSNSSEAVSVSISSEQKLQPTFTFTFGKNLNENKVSGGDLFGQKNQNNLFTFGQKSAEETTQNSAGSNVNMNQPSTTQISQFNSNLSVTQSSLFGQNVSQTSGTSQITTQTSTFCQSANSVPQTTSAFGSKSDTISFGQPSLTSAFAQNSTDFSTKNPPFGASGSNQPVGGFPSPVTTQSTGFGVPAPNQSPAFGSSTTTQPTNAFNTPATQSASGFGLSSTSQVSLFSQPFGQNNKTDSAVVHSSNIFGQQSINQNPASSSSFSSALGSNFSVPSDQSSIFGQKTNGQTNIFGQNPQSQASQFVQNSTSQSFGTQSSFSFGMSTSAGSGSTVSTSNTTTPAIFNFSGSTPSQTSAFSFGSNSSVPNNGQTRFGFSSPTNDTFKFGAATGKEALTSSSTTFGFGIQTNNNVASEVKPSSTVFNFGSPQAPGQTFTFGSTPSPSVFSFGGSGSSTNSGSTFNFGAPQANVPFGQATATPFSVPGTFSIGSGSSQPKPRASSRLRRRP